jgi:hypothetical protein
MRLGRRRNRFPISGPSPRKTPAAGLAAKTSPTRLVPSRQRPAAAWAYGAGPPDLLAGREAEGFGVGPAVVLGQDLAEVAGLVRDGAVADLTAREREMGDGHGEAAGT